MDQELRALERRARGGEPAALEALLQARRRAGALTPVQQRLLEAPLPPGQADWTGALAQAGLELLLSADLELARAAAPRLAAALPDPARLEALLAACDQALGPSSAGPGGPADAAAASRAGGGGRCADDPEPPSQASPATATPDPAEREAPRRRRPVSALEQALRAARLRSRVGLASLGADLVEETARGLVCLSRGDRLGAERHARAAAARGTALLGEEPARELARRGALLQTVRGAAPEDPLELTGEATPEELRARLAAGTLRLADVGLAAFAGHPAALALLPARLAPWTPAPLEDWLARLAADWGPLPNAQAWLAIARGLGLDPARVRALEELLAAGDDDRVEAALDAFEPAPRAPAVELAGLALAALLSGAPEALLPRVMAHIRAARVRQTDVREATARALAAWALQPGTRFPGVGVAWTTAGDRSRARSAAFRAHVLEFGGQPDPGLATPTQLARIYAGMASAGLDVRGLLDLVAQAGAPRPEALKRELAAWVLEQLRARRAPPPRVRKRRPKRDRPAPDGP